MKKFNAKNLMFFLAIMLMFQIGSLAQTNIGLLPVTVTFKEKDNRSTKEKKADRKARSKANEERIEALKNGKIEKPSEKEWRKKREEKEKSEYEELFSLMLTKHLIEALEKEEIKLTEIAVAEMTEEERTGERKFYGDAVLHQLVKLSKDYSKGKFKKLKTDKIEKNEPSVFIQTVAKKYDKQYVIFMNAVGSYDGFWKKKMYSDYGSDLKAVRGSFSVKILLYEKTEGKKIYLTDFKIAQYTRDSKTRIQNSQFIHGKGFKKFGKKMAKEIKKAIKKNQ